MKGPLDGPFSAQRCVPRPCEWCGKEHEFWQDVWDCAMYHVLIGAEKKFPRPEEPKPPEICRTCGQERKE